MINKDCDVVEGKNRFRYRVAGLIIKDDKCLFITSESLKYIYTLGGGVKIGESSEEAIIREVYEELGVKCKVVRLAAIIENFFTGTIGVIKDDRCHALEFYYILNVEEEELEAKSINMDGDLEEVRWLDINNLENFDVRPAVLKNRITEIINSKEVIHIINKKM